MSNLPPPTEPFSPESVAWQNYFLELSNIELDAAPTDARYLVATSNGELTNDVNLGALTTGIMLLTVAAGIATPSTVTQLTLLRGGTGADLSATGGASQVVQQASAGAVFTVGQLAAADLSDVAASTYTPTLTNVTNLSASTAFACQYMRVGSVVTVSGKFSVDPTAAGACELGISLPIASALAAAEQCGGVAFASGIAGQGAAIYADATNDRASVQWVAVDVTNQPMAFQFQYRII